jgi:hypothetical protein
MLLSDSEYLCSTDNFDIHLAIGMTYAMTYTAVKLHMDYLQLASSQHHQGSKQAEMDIGKNIYRLFYAIKLSLFKLFQTILASF